MVKLSQVMTVSGFDVISGLFLSNFPKYHKYLIRTASKTTMFVLMAKYDKNILKLLKTQFTIFQCLAQVFYSISLCSVLKVG